MFDRDKKEQDSEDDLNSLNYMDNYEAFIVTI